MTLREHEFTDLPTLTGPMRIHIIRPAAAGQFPGIVLWSGIFQVTGPIRRTAALLAGHGFIVAVPEVYHELEEPGTVLAWTPPGRTVATPTRSPAPSPLTIPMPPLPWPDSKPTPPPTQFPPHCSPAPGRRW